MIAIKGMEMPDTCSDCDLCHGHICKVTGTDIVSNPKGDCPLVELVTCEEICLRGHELIHVKFFCTYVESEEEE